MRLIDADTLTPDTEWDDYEDGFVSYSQRQIDNALTVNAVCLPDNATNGDIIKVLFGDNYSAKKAWWDAPFKRND